MQPYLPKYVTMTLSARCDAKFTSPAETESVMIIAAGQPAAADPRE
jgi:hypothetical protein